MNKSKNIAQFLEDWYPYITSLILTVAGVLMLRLTRLSSWTSIVVHGCATLLPSTLNISAIAVGFLATSQSVLLSLGKTKIVKLLKQNGHYARLLNFFKSAIGLSFIWALMSALLTTFNFNRGGSWRYFFLAVWVFLSGCSILSYLRATQLLTDILMLEQETAKPKENIQEWNPEKYESGNVPNET